MNTVIQVTSSIVRTLYKAKYVTELGFLSVGGVIKQPDLRIGINCSLFMPK